jgi:hypothetical protein
MNYISCGRKQSWSVQRYPPRISHKGCMNTIKHAKAGYLTLERPKYDAELKQLRDEYKRGPTKWN